MGSGPARHPLITQGGKLVISLSPARVAPRRHGRLIPQPAVIELLRRRHARNFFRRFRCWVLLIQPALDLAGGALDLGRRDAGRIAHVTPPRSEYMCKSL